MDKSTIRPTRKKVEKFQDSGYDPYVYHNGTLQNKLGITDYQTLNAKEKELLAERIVTPELVKGQRMDTNLLRQIHKFYFEPIFDWAGEYRTVPLFKLESFFIPGISVTYSNPKDIKKELSDAIKSLNSVRWKRLEDWQIAREFVMHLTKIWKVHPFRDGNTRAVLGFAKIYALEHGFPLNMTVLTNLLSRPEKDGKVIGYSIRDMFVGACIEEAPEPEHLIKVFQKSMI